MLPEIWGRHAWKFIHLVALGYPINPTQEDTNNYRQFVESLQYILPCAECRNHFAKNLQLYPLTDKVMSSRNNLLKWTIDIHNTVNKATGKRRLTYIEAMSELTNLTNINKNNNQIIIMLVVVLVILIAYYLKFIKN